MEVETCIVMYIQVKQIIEKEKKNNQLLNGWRKILMRACSRFTESHYDILIKNYVVKKKKKKKLTCF